jgi:hypothetical protein
MTEFAAPRPVTLDGKEYRFAPITLIDIEELDNWVRKEYMTRVFNAIPEGVTKADRDHAMEIAQAKAVNLTWLSGQGAVFIASHRGMLKVAQLGLSKNHPELTEERLREILVKDKTAIREISDALKSPKSAFQTRQAKVVRAARSKGSRKR